MLKKKKVLGSIIIITLLVILGTTSVFAAEYKGSKYDVELYHNSYITDVQTGRKATNSSVAYNTITTSTLPHKEFYIMNSRRDYTKWTTCITSDKQYTLAYTAKPEIGEVLKLRARTTYSVLHYTDCTGYIDFK